MNVINRDKFLTEQFGGCWHEFDNAWTFRCLICNKTLPEISLNDDFSTPDGFFKLWNWVQKQSWYDHFMWKVDPFRNYHKALSGPPMSSWIIEPNDFADKLFKYLKDEL